MNNLVVLRAGGSRREPSRAAALAAGMEDAPSGVLANLWAAVRLLCGGRRRHCRGRAVGEVLGRLPIGLAVAIQLHVRLPGWPPGSWVHTGPRWHRRLTHTVLL